MKKWLKTSLALSLIGNLLGTGVSAQAITPSQVFQASYEVHSADNFGAIESGFFTLNTSINTRGIGELDYAIEGNLMGLFNINIPREKLAFDGYLLGDIEIIYNEEVEPENRSESVEIYLNLFENWLYVDNQEEMTKYYVEDRVKEFFQIIQEKIANTDNQLTLPDNDRAFLDTYFHVYEGDEEYTLRLNYDEADPQAMWEDLKTTSFYTSILEALNQAYDQVGLSIDLSQENLQTLIDTILENLFYSLRELYAIYDKETSYLRLGSIRFEITGETILNIVDILAEKGIPITTSSDERANLEEEVKDLFIEIDTFTSLRNINEVDLIQKPYYADDYIEVEVED